MNIINKEKTGVPGEKEASTPKQGWRSRNPFSRTGHPASWFCISRSSRKLANEALTLRKKGNLTGAFVKFQLAASKQTNWRFGAKLREMAGDAMFEIAEGEFDPYRKNESLRSAAEEYHLAAVHMKKHNPKRAREINALADALYTRANSSSVAENNNWVPVK